MDAFSDPNVEAVYAMKGTQIGWTDILNNVVGFHIDQDPAPILVIQPTVEMGEAWSKDRLAPMLRDTPCLKGKVPEGRSRDGGNTIRLKEFPGGRITITGANSPASLAMRPIRIVLGDEVDRYPASAGDEGDPLTLAYKRAETFWNRKLAAGSSPTIAGHSTIEERFEESDKRRFFVPCVECGEFHFLKWAQVKWTNDDPKSSGYVCESCGTFWKDSDRHESVHNGEWRATAPFNGIAGFHIPQLLSPWVAVEKMVAEFIAARGNPSRLKVFVNTVLAETWKEKGEAPEWQRLYDRAEDYPIGTAPKGVVFITLGIDVQHDRIEVYVWGWARGLESWLVEHRVLNGDPYGHAVWDALTACIGETWTHEGGALLSPAKVAIDSGYATTQVYAWVKKQRPDLVIAVKGVERGAAGVGMPQVVDAASAPGKKKSRRAATVWPVVGGIYKSELYGFLRLEAPTRESGEAHPPGFVHLGKFPDEMFKQITAEQLVTKTIKFRRKTEWEKTRERNEALDCRVYARAAASVYGVDRFQDQHWALLEEHLKNQPAKKATPKPATEETRAEAEAGPQPAKSSGWLGTRRRGNWLKR